MKKNVHVQLMQQFKSNKYKIPRFAVKCDFLEKFKSVFKKRMK